MALRQRSLEKLRKELTGLRNAMLAQEKDGARLLRAIEPTHRKSAVNLLHYVALRSVDVRKLQLQLAEWGLSSLGRSEAHALDSVDRLLGILGQLSKAPAPVVNAGAASLTEGADLLEQHADALLGTKRRGHPVRVMVTMPSEAASDYALVRDLVRAGMDCMRINCAHDDSKAWIDMTAHLKRARRELGRECRILMDLPGPKIRTGPIEAAPAVIKIKPQRDELGRVKRAARIWLTASKASAAEAAADAALLVDPKWLSGLRTGIDVRLHDTRGRTRKLRVTSVGKVGAWADSTHTAYITNGTILKNPEASHAGPRESKVSGIAEEDGSIDLKVGDTLVLTRTLRVGKSAQHNEHGGSTRPAHVACNPPHALSAVKKGDRVLFDDGKLTGEVTAVNAGEVRVRITRTQPGGSGLKAETAINFPDRRQTESAPTRNDLDDLEIVIKHADLVGLSFVNDPADVRRLIKQLRRKSKRPPGIILKIETRRGFEALPAILLAAMQHPAYGVMVARGDLAVECGYERLAEVQEEILWLCEAAHCPAIWATQVLESLAKKGTPSRAEITDAAMGQRTECVMLNKGPYILDAVEMLEGIFKRMSAHQSKKRSLMRALTIAKEYRRLGR